MNKFIFKSYAFDTQNYEASFNYAFADGREFTEKVSFERGGDYDGRLLDRALFLAFILAGTSYYKTFPSVEVEVRQPIDDWQAEFFNKVYQEGLGQFAFENNFTRDNLAHFKASSSKIIIEPVSYISDGILALQSGGKDSLLTASLLQEKSQEFTAWYVSSSVHHPVILDKIGAGLVVSVRSIDNGALKKALTDGGKNGHVPVTYILQSFAVIQAILLGKQYILSSIAHEGEEAHLQIGDMSVTHQWSKTWSAETGFSEYVIRYISPDLHVGSPLRSHSELRVAELFVKHSWDKYGHDFSSCNIANYKQGDNNSVLSWCGDCPKCANSYLLFAPFVPSDDLQSLFGGQDLFVKPSLEKIFKGLLGIDNEPKPFECIGEIEELRLAYHISQTLGGFKPLSFDVPQSAFDYMKQYPAQDWATKILE